MRKIIAPYIDRMYKSETYTTNEPLTQGVKFYKTMFGKKTGDCKINYTILVRVIQDIIKYFFCGQKVEEDPLSSKRQDSKRQENERRKDTTVQEHIRALQFISQYDIRCRHTLSRMT